MTDKFLEEQLPKQLKPGETALYRGMVSRPFALLPVILLAFACMVLIGIPIMVYMFTMAPAGKRWGGYYAVLTSQRLLLIRYTMQSGKHVFGWLEEFPRATIKRVVAGGIGNNRSIAFELADGSVQGFRAVAWPERVTGHTAFLKEMPERFNAGQLAA
jgi:hypothetical protein